jgi:hypothetical protein
MIDWKIVCSIVVGVLIYRVVFSYLIKSFIRAFIKNLYIKVDKIKGDVVRKKTFQERVSELMEEKNGSTEG